MFKKNYTHFVAYNIKIIYFTTLMLVENYYLELKRLFILICNQNYRN